jgi:hypothetical protein
VISSSTINAATDYDLSQVIPRSKFTTCPTLEDDFDDTDLGGSSASEGLLAANESQRMKLL